VPRLLILSFLLGLAACAGDEPPTLRTGVPSVNVAEAALAAGAPQVALNVANGILANDKRDRAALLTQAEALSALGRPTEAEASYAELLNLDPESTPALIGMGRIRLRRDPAQAQVLFQSALQHEPRNTIALSNLGVALDLQGDHAGAQSAYRKALGLDPRSRAAQVNLALSMALSGHATEAVDMLRPYASGPDASPRVRHDLAAAMAIAGDAEGAGQLLGRDMSPTEVDRAVQSYRGLVP
jgi:Flp pilus assembly protein TadD